MIGTRTGVLPRLVDSTVAALHVRTAHHIDIAPATIRSWAQRGRITRYDGPRPYDLNEVDAFARSRQDVGS